MLFHEDDAAQVFYQPGTADNLVITFSEMTTTFAAVCVCSGMRLRERGSNCAR
ncbi:hypothetical protein ACFQX4_22720 [Roseomonas sp. GCM10028921]